ncbi:hypothetical protein ACFRAU_11125 [Arthrobacter sp. NPDC056691]|uniref:hypothetical protein n=1 Tax=Arthrobacter sp. NPDC056691 TaxID=3345913 RepID=UPI0036710E14
MVGIVEIAFFRQRIIGFTENQRKQYVTNVIKVILTSGAASLATIVFVIPGLGRENTPQPPSYTPILTLVVVVVAALITYRLERASESPDTVYDLQSDLRKSWLDEEDLKRHAIARRRAWLRGFEATNGGRSMVSSKRSLNPDFQDAVDESLGRDYKDVRFRRLALRTTPKMLKATLRGHPWRSLWLLTPLLTVVFSWVTTLTLWSPEGKPDASSFILPVTVSLAIGLALSYFNFWARSTSGLRKYCELKRYEALCNLMLTKFERLSAAAQEPTSIAAVQAAPATTQQTTTASIATADQLVALQAALEAHLQADSPGIIRRALRKLW